MTSSGRRDFATGADAVVAALEELGVTVAFGQPGVHNLPIWTALSHSEIRMVGVRHEQTAAYAADGLARTTGGVGVAITTTGPGAVNAASAIGEAFASRSPVVLIATNVPSTLRRPGVYRAALHETRDQAGIFAPITLAAFEVEDPDEIYATVVAASRLAIEAPSGPVYVEIPADLLAAAATSGAAREPSPDSARSAIRNGDGDHGISAAAARLDAAERPLIWAGGGAARSPGARGPVQRLAERLGAPVLETYMGRGLIDREHPAYVGVPPHAPQAGDLWDAADVVVAIGSDLDGMTTQNWRMPSPPQLIAINVDPDDASKNYEPDVMLVGDAVELAGRLTDALPGPPRSDGLRARLASSFGVPCERVSDAGGSLAEALGRHAALDGPSMIIAEAALSPPPTTSPRWYRAASSG